MPFKYRADQVGSLLRPQELIAARKNPDTTPEQLQEIQDKHILRILAKQQELGFKIFSDGETRRRGFMSDFHESVNGLDMDGSVARAWKAAAGSGGRDPSGTLSGI